jgi:hypothetical protein
VPVATRILAPGRFAVLAFPAAFRKKITSGRAIADERFRAAVKKRDKLDPISSATFVT